LDGEMPQQRSGGRERGVARRARRLHVNHETLDAPIAVGDREHLANPFFQQSGDSAQPSAPLELDDGKPADRFRRYAIGGEMPDRRDVHPRAELAYEPGRREPLELVVSAAEQAQAADRRREDVHALRTDPNALPDLE